VARSDANFLWCDTGGAAAELVQALAARGVLVKCFKASSDPRIERHIRVTVGLPDDTNRLLEELARCR
jgi:histidinol-phosphate/aromatic aminotransferase/cobyric acid decarboxylase-like protein